MTLLVGLGLLALMRRRRAPATHPVGVLLVESVTTLPQVLTTMHRYAPHAQVVQTQTRVRV